MAYDGTDLVRNVAKDANNLLTVENALMLSTGLYNWTGLADEIYAIVQATPEQLSYCGLPAGEIYNAIIAVQAFTALLDANNQQHRKALARIVKARNS